MKEFLLDAPLTRDFFTYLGYFGQVEALPNVGDGFYKFEKQEWFMIKGFLGDTTIEVRFRKEVMDFTTDFLYFLLASYREGTMDLSVLKQRERSVGERVRKHLHGV
jgi:hypothetical protein